MTLSQQTENGVNVKESVRRGSCIGVKSSFSSSTFPLVLFLATVVRTKSLPHFNNSLKSESEQCSNREWPMLRVEESHKMLMQNGCLVNWDWSGGVGQ